MSVFQNKTFAVFLLTAWAAMAQVPPPLQAAPNGPASPVLQEQPRVSFDGRRGHRHGKRDAGRTPSAQLPFSAASDTTWEF